MRFDLYAELASQTACPTEGSLPAGLASGFLDGCTSWFASKEIERAFAEAQEKRAQSQPDRSQARERKNAAEREKNAARQRYMERASSPRLELPSWLQLDPPFDRLPDSSWLAFEVMFTLETPWYSKDDRPFHVLDNPLRKDRVFGVPYLAAASWKGLLRWACQMQAGLLGYLEQHGGKLESWSDPSWIVHLFGNEKGEAEEFQRGALAFYPTWFDKISFEVINPHSRKTRAGTQPIYYEVVPAGTEGTLRLLYAPLPSAAARDKVTPGKAIERLLESVEVLLTTYGMSAKRTAGWGTASVSQWTAYRRGQTPIQASALADFKTKVKPWVSATEAPRA
jgi:CRISPR-associated protein Cmr2